MLLKNKYAIGTHIMFYEIDMIDDFVNSCIIALGNVDNKTNVVFDFCLNMSQYFESYDTPDRKEYVIDKWNEVIKPLEELIIMEMDYNGKDIVNRYSQYQFIEKVKNYLYRFGLVLDHDTVENEIKQITKE